MSLPAIVRLSLSGQRFVGVYQIQADAADALSLAKSICVEQTVEFPADLLPAGEIESSVVGRLESLSAMTDGDDRGSQPAHLNLWEARISYAVETVGAEWTQWLNVLFGNASLLPGVRLLRLQLPADMQAAFPGPRFGIAGIRARLQAFERPLLCTALKPMGLSAEQLAELAFEFALGGIDLIKDDHGLADQSFARWEERVQRCVESVARANAITGGHSVYLPNVTAAPEIALQRSLFAGQHGAGGLLISPGLAGWETMHRIACADDVALPVVSHPAFLGSYVVRPDSGLSHYALFGQLMRLAGADAIVFPNHGGRFSFRRDECLDIAAGARDPMGGVRPAFPAPGGGMDLPQVPQMVSDYGIDVTLLIGGALFRADRSVTDAAKRFRDLIDVAARG